MRFDLPAPARVWDCLAGGKDNLAPDRAVAETLVAEFPDLRATARATRRFVDRAVRVLAAEGADQFLYIGCGFPWSPYVHDVAQQFVRYARVVYVDNDPLVAVHGRALLTHGTPEGRSEFLHADLREPDTILTSPILLGTLDLTRPVGLVLSGVLHDIPDTDQPQQAVKHLVQALAPGSHVVLSHLTADRSTPGSAQRLTELAAANGYGPLCLRSRAEVTRFLDGLDLLDPGVVDVEHWRSDPSGEPPSAMCWAAVGRLP